MSNLVTRALTGAVYVALTLGAAWAGPFTTYLLFLPVAIIAGDELHRLIWAEGQGPSRIGCMVAVGVIYTTFSLAVFDGTHLPLAIQLGVVLCLLLIALMGVLRIPAPDPSKYLGGSLLLIALVALPFAAMINLFSYGTEVFIGFMVMLWTSDTGAYLVGRSIGRTKLLPAVSPNKTVEGFLGGVIFSVGVAYLFSLYHPALGTGTWVISGALVAITSTIGDLLESSFKRASGVKDSGTILPGHGGMLDRFDGALVAAPCMVVYLAIAH